MSKLRIPPAQSGTSPERTSNEVGVSSPLRPQELPFTAEERGTVTILFGGLTWKHERLIEGLLTGAGYLCQHLPETDRAAHEMAQEYCASGLCNPVYFTVGNLLRYLRRLQDSGLSAADIVKKYVYFTAACGGPCRFGMYESEFRTALAAAGFKGFRVLSFSQDRGIHASSGHSGLHFTLDFGFNAMHAFILGDLLNAAQRRVRPFEVQPGATERALARMTGGIADHFKTYHGFELDEIVPRRLCPPSKSPAYYIPNRTIKYWTHLYGNALTTILPAVSHELQEVEVDWLRVKPVVKVIGEFWAQMTESDGNFRMLDFLEKEGAEVSIEPISTWLLYLLHQREDQAAYRGQMLRYSAPWSAPKSAFRARLLLLLKRLGFSVGSAIYRHHFYRLARLLEFPQPSLAPQKEIAELAADFYNTRLRGGEGHLEVGKTLYYTQKKMCHLVLALKPFGCLPSVQSDAVQASLVERFPEVSFLPIETSADGEIHAYSRAQMALSEARAKALSEFDKVLQSTHRSVEEIREFVADRPELRHPLHQIPRTSGVVSIAANFVLYADRLMSADRRKRARSWAWFEQQSDNAALGPISSKGD
jgi:predicted nucleotide-binding protein (sugar kinase/HSP70/actin superfamily)